VTGPIEYVVCQSSVVRIVVLGCIAVLASACAPAVGAGLSVVTDPSIRGAHEGEVCAAGAYLPPVAGVLIGQASAPPQYVWLRSDGGESVYIAWPSGFTVRFAPEAQLLDEAGQVFAKAGDRIELPSVDPAAHAGTKDDPYPAVGIIGDRCFWDDNP